MSPKLKKFINPYTIITAIFLVIIVFVSDNNLLAISSLKKDIIKLRKEEANLQEAMVEDSIKAQRLKSDLTEIEKYGRETYYMKRANEDIYIINKTKSK